VNELEQIERAAFRSMWLLAPTEIARSEGIASAEVGGATCVAFRGAGTTMLNRAFGVGVERATTERDLDAITSFFAGRSDRFAVAVAPFAQPKGLPDMLTRRGFTPGYAWMKFRRDTSAAPAAAATSDLTVVEVGRNPDGDFGTVVAEGFGLPGVFARWWSRIAHADGWHCFVAYAGTEPAAAGALYVEGELGWLGVAATRPAFRGRGGQTAILAARIDAARRLGAAVVVTETGVRVDDRPSASYRNILRAGFEEAYARPNYELSATT
jgi:GNAT superfamily N-acetyltransferase